MRNILILFVCYTLFACEKHEVSTRISGSVLEAGSLKTLYPDSLSMSIYKHESDGTWGGKSVEIACLKIEDGSYDYSFTAETYGSYKMIASYPLEKYRRYYFSEFEIEPGTHQVRDLLVSKAIHLNITAIDTNRFPSITSITVRTGLYASPTTTVWTDSTNTGDTIHFGLKLQAGALYNCEYIWHSAGYGTLFSDKVFYNTPHNEALERTIYY